LLNKGANGTEAFKSIFFFYGGVDKKVSLLYALWFFDNSGLEPVSHKEEKMVTTNSQTETIEKFTELMKQFYQKTSVIEATDELVLAAEQKEVAVMNAVIGLIKPILKYITTEELRLCNNDETRACWIIKNNAYGYDQCNLFIQRNGDFVHYNKEFLMAPRFKSISIEYSIKTWGLEAIIKGLTDAFDQYIKKQEERSVNAKIRIELCTNVLEALRP
jgi:hypothetical protein